MQMRCVPEGQHRIPAGLPQAARPAGGVKTRRREMTHDELAAEIQHRAGSRGLLSHYCQRSTTCKGSRGMPDLIIAGIHGVIFVEIKSIGEDPAPDQATWIYTLRAGGQDAYVLRETDLSNGSLNDLLAKCAGTVTRAELPLRVTEDENGALAIRCQCGAEFAVTNGRLLREEFSPAALLRMILHAKRHKNSQMTLI
jgi:hypothetical protein